MRRENPGICWVAICAVKAAAMNMSLVVFPRLRQEEAFASALE
jgi:hypothetical protein